MTSLQGWSRGSVRFQDSGSFTLSAYGSQHVVFCACACCLMVSRCLPQFQTLHLLFKKYLFIYLFILGCVGSSFLCEGFLQLRRVGATLHRGARASHRRGLSCCGAQAPDAQAPQLWLMGPVAPWHLGSSQTRARTHVPCIGRQILNHCAFREALHLLLRQEKGEKGQNLSPIMDTSFQAPTLRLPLLSYWPELCHIVTSSYKGGWERPYLSREGVTMTASN